MQFLLISILKKKTQEKSTMRKKNVICKIEAVRRFFSLVYEMYCIKRSLW